MIIINGKTAEGKDWGKIYDGLSNLVTLCELFWVSPVGMCERSKKVVTFRKCVFAHLKLIFEYNQ